MNEDELMEITKNFANETKEKMSKSGDIGVYLIGSLSEGCWHPGSDIDTFIIRDFYCPSKCSVRDDMLKNEKYDLIDKHLCRRFCYTEGRFLKKISWNSAVLNIVPERNEHELRSFIFLKGIMHATTLQDFKPRYLAQIQEVLMDTVGKKYASANNFWKPKLDIYKYIRRNLLSRNTSL